MRKINTLFNIIYWKITDVLWHFHPEQKHIPTPSVRYSIGIVTYINRYDIFFKSLIGNLCKLFPDVEIIIAINGYYDEEKQKKYLVDIGRLLSKYPNVKKIEYTKGQSLSKLWNQLIIHSINSKTFIFNDDIKITPKFRKELENSGILNEDVVLLNKSWSHFLISKKTISTMGWFDERFPGVGNEDEDYEARLVIQGVLVKSFSIQALKSIIYMTTDFSYAKETDVVNKKYVKANKIFFDSKWDSSETPQEGYSFVRIPGKHLKIKPFMETPNFYPELNYAER